MEEIPPGLILQVLKMGSPMLVITGGAIAHWCAEFVIFRRLRLRAKETGDLGPLELATSMWRVATQVACIGTGGYLVMNLLRIL